MKYIIVAKEDFYMEYPLGAQGEIEGIPYEAREYGLSLDGKELPLYEWQEIQGQWMLLLGEDRKIYERENVVFLGDKGDVSIPDSPVKMYLEQMELVVVRGGTDHLYLNQERIGEGTYSLEEGAVLLVGQMQMIVGKNTLEIHGKDYACQLLLARNQAQQPENYPEYKRSPRLIKRIEEETVKIEPEPKTGKPGVKNLFQTILPPLCMLAVTVAIGIVMKRGMMLLMSASATGMTAVFSVIKYVQDRKEFHRINEKKKEVYGNYLLAKRKELWRKWRREQEAYDYNYPKLAELSEMVSCCDSRIYERTNMDDDFLTFCVGHSSAPTAFTVEDKLGELNLDITEYQKEIQDMKKQFTTIDKPQIVDLKRSHLGLVGRKSVLHEQLQQYICQIAFAQSYHDVQFVVICHEEYRQAFAWMRWLSHARLQGLNVYGLVDSEKSRDQVLASLQQILKERKQKVEEEHKEARFLPHYVFIVDEPKMILDHSIMEFLTGDQGFFLGYSLIYTSHLQANLPENIGTVLLAEGADEGRLLLEEKQIRDLRLHFYRRGDTDLETFARNLGVLRHVQGMSSQVPESITFFEMYGIRNPEELQIAQRWRQHNSSKTLAVPLGARSGNEILELNLHEKARGPHGLVAGTTGSGKSEIVQSYILSLAVNFQPYEVGFLLIDYKGGGMANLFRDLPHLLGTITNLDGSESMRALASVQAENKRREHIFGVCGVNNINAYNDLFREGKVEEPLPHLFIISDEFAELKKEQPEFMQELVSVARVGRSLGVHLILATQKPTGVVDEQIWSNSRFRLCLKVQNEGDSKEVLHTPDAANITQAGRAYLQVGNNEIYELFQSAWSGARYIREKEEAVTEDDRVYLVNELGQGELINQDLRGTTAERKATQTQLEVVVSHIKEVYDRQHFMQVKRPWLPSLGEKLVCPYTKVKACERVNLEIPVGVRDVPELQLQEEYHIDLCRQGNVLMIASSGYGKSFFLANAVISLAAKNQVSALNFYVLDFGNNALISLRRLPHMADYIMLDDEEKYEKFRKLMEREIKDRKKVLASAMAQNFTVYNEMADSPLKAMVIIIDNYDAIKEMGYEMEQYYTRLTRDGVGLGIYVIATASQSSVLRMATMNNFKNKIAGVNVDENEVKALVGRSQYTLPDIKGRAMVKVGERVDVMQLYTAVDFADEVEYGRNLQAYVEKIANANAGEEAPHIPVLPDELNVQGFLQYPVEQVEERVAYTLGLDWESVRRVGVSSRCTPFLIFGDGGSGKTNALKLILHQLQGERVQIVDSKKRKLYGFREMGTYIDTMEAAEQMILALREELAKRKQALAERLAKGEDLQYILDSFSPYYVLVDDVDDFIELMGVQNMLAAVGTLKRAMEHGITLIATADANKFRGSDELTMLLKATKDGLLLSGQSYFTIFPVKTDDIPSKPRGYLMLEGRGRHVWLPKGE